jgi:RNA polymerase sigma-70 factor (ECF subfamily)
MAETEKFPLLFMPIQGELLAHILAVGVSPSDADDVLQESACIMLRKLGDYRDGTNFRAWAYAIVKNEARNHLRRCKRRLLLLDEQTIAGLENLSSGPCEAESDLSRRLLVCIRKLGEEARRLLDMRYADGKSVSSIAAALGRSADSVSVTLSRIRTALRRCVDQAASIEEQTV